MNIKRLALAPALAVAFGGLTTLPAVASSEPLSADAVTDLAVASCQLDPDAPLSAEELAPNVIAESDVEVVPGEITVHVVRAEVQTSADDVQQCTFGVLHRDALLKQVTYEGIATVALGDDLGGSLAESVTLVELGNMGKSSPIDPTTEVALGGFVTPLDATTEDPTYDVTLERTSIEVVQIAVHKAEKDAAARLLKAQLKAAEQLKKRELKAAAHGKNAEKRIAAAKKAYDRRVAAAQAAYTRATTPKTVSRPVGHTFSVSGSVTAPE